MNPVRAAILAEARGWIGTPYCHRASVRGEGADCLGLGRGVWRAVIGPEPAALPAYAPDWAEATRSETLLDT
ncbi:MAG: peptidase P60, partial [Azorhizobium sp. 39-67-5]